MSEASKRSSWSCSDSVRSQHYFDFFSWSPIGPQIERDSVSQSRKAVLTSVIIISIIIALDRWTHSVRGGVCVHGPVEPGLRERSVCQIRRLRRLSGCCDAWRRLIQPATQRSRSPSLFPYSSVWSSSIQFHWNTFSGIYISTNLYKLVLTRADKTERKLLVETRKPIKYNQKNKQNQKTRQLRKLKSNIYLRRSLAYLPTTPHNFVLV